MTVLKIQHECACVNRRQNRRPGDQANCQCNDDGSIDRFILFKTRHLSLHPPSSLSWFFYSPPGTLSVSKWSETRGSWIPAGANRSHVREAAAAAGARWSATVWTRRLVGCWWSIVWIWERETETGKMNGGETWEGAANLCEAWALERWSVRGDGCQEGRGWRAGTERRKEKEEGVTVLVHVKVRSRNSVSIFMCWRKQTECHEVRKVAWFWL